MDDNILDLPPRIKQRSRVDCDDLPDEATHHEMAEHYISGLGDPAPVALENGLWVWSEPAGLWIKLTIEKISTEIGSRYRSKNCKRASDYRGIASYIYDLLIDPSFFDQAPIGLAVKGAFYSVIENEIKQLPLTHELRQRFAIDITPVQGDMVRFIAFLEGTFAHADPDIKQQQIALIQEIIGAILTGIAYKYELVVLLIGPGSGGKSTLLRIIEAMIPTEYVAAISPFTWGREYNVAGLAGKRLNLVGELPVDKYIPADVFKQVTGRDRVTGRYPYGRPFDFLPTAAHLFNSNHFPNTRDQTSGFWRRWLCVGFDNPVPETCREKDLDKEITQDELPAIIYWALEGAARVVAQDGFSHSARSNQILEEWRQKADAVAEYVNDTEAVLVDRNHDTPRSEVYSAFRLWCRESERKPMGKQTFYARLEGLGFRFKRINGYDFVEGVQLLLKP